MGFFGILCFLISIAITFFVLSMLGRFVRAHESIAESMGELASKSISKEIASMRQSEKNP